MGAKKLSKNTFVDSVLNLIGKKIKKAFLSIAGLGITLTNNEIKEVIKVIKSIENSGILFKGTTRKITSQEGGFLNFPKLSMTVVLPLMKSLLKTLAKNILIPFGLSTAMPATDATIQKKGSWIRYNNYNN